MRRIAAACAVVALLFVVAGCPGTQKVKDLESQVAAQQQKITELEGQVQMLTAAKDSLTKVIADMTAKKTPGKTPGTTPTTPPGKPPRTGR